MNDNDSVIREIEKTDRRLWKEGGGTVEGFFSLCHRLSQQALAEYDAQGDAWRGMGRIPAKPRKRKAAARNAPARGKKMIARKEKEEAAE